MRTNGRSAMPRPAACLRAAVAKAVLNTVTVGIPRRSISTASATLIEVEVPQSPKHCTTASHCARLAKSPSDSRSFGAALRMTGPGSTAKRSASCAATPLNEKIGVALAVVDEAKPLAAKFGEPFRNRNNCRLIGNGGFEQLLRHRLAFPMDLFGSKIIQIEAWQAETLRAPIRDPAQSSRTRGTIYASMTIFGAGRLAPCKLSRTRAAMSR